MLLSLGTHHWESTEAMGTENPGPLACVGSPQEGSADTAQPPR